MYNDYEKQQSIIKKSNEDAKRTAAYKQQQQRTQKITMYAVYTVTDCIIAAVIFVLAALVCRGQFNVYMKYVFIPFFAFFAGFFNTFFMRRCKGTLLIVPPLCFISHFIFAGFHWNAFMWLLLYIANWIIGVAVAVLALSYRKRKK